MEEGMIIQFYRKKVGMTQVKSLFLCKFILQCFQILGASLLNEHSILAVLLWTRLDSCATT